MVWLLACFHRCGLMMPVDARWDNAAGFPKRVTLYLHDMTKFNYLEVQWRHTPHSGCSADLH